MRNRDKNCGGRSLSVTLKPHNLRELRPGNTTGTAPLRIGFEIHGGDTHDVSSVPSDQVGSSGGIGGVLRGRLRDGTGSSARCRGAGGAAAGSGGYGLTHPAEPRRADAT